MSASGLQYIDDPIHRPELKGLLYTHKIHRTEKKKIRFYLYIEKKSIEKRLLAEIVGAAAAVDMTGP